MQTITIDNITQAAIDRGDGGKTHPRLYEIYTILVKHLHSFVREVNLTEPELQQGRDFLNRASRHTQLLPDGEIHLLTDLLGISELVLLLQDRNSQTTESNLEGPLYVPNAPERQLGDRLGVDPEGEPLLLSGRVLDVNGQAIANALIEVWQPNSRGLYDIIDPSQPAGNFRGQFRTDDRGNYSFETVVPSGYDVPNDGPCGEVLQMLGRNSWRAAHIHFKLSAPGYSPLTTQIFMDSDPLLTSDTTFAVRTAIVKLQKHESGNVRVQQQSQSFSTAEFDFVLKSASPKKINLHSLSKNNLNVSSSDVISGEKMKKIEAIVPTDDLALVQAALANSEIIDMTVSTVHTYNLQMRQVQRYRGVEFTKNLIPNLKVEIVLESSQVDLLVAKIADVIRTAEFSAGKIFITPIEQAIQPYLTAV
jgi:hydroxyquinol 1,2-dioxygenase